jgi:hypothetical protein
VHLEDAAGGVERHRTRCLVDPRLGLDEGLTSREGLSG